MSIEKIVVVTQKTRLEGLLDRFNTRAQAKFWIEHMGLRFEDYDDEHDTYRRAVEEVRRRSEAFGLRMQQVDRSFLPTLVFSPQDLVTCIGRDGLVVNAAKYVGGRPIVGVNPDPARWDGVLLPFAPATVERGLRAVIEERPTVMKVTMAQVALNDGQSLLAFNDFLIGRKDQVSARYVIRFRKGGEAQSSSGILVATGAGSTGWLSSVQNSADTLAHLLLPSVPALPRLRMAWDDPRLAFVVREPYRSRSSGVAIGAGLIEPGESLAIESEMPEGGAIFSDGVPDDALAFDAGCVATVTAARAHGALVMDPAATLLHSAANSSREVFGVMPS